MLVRILNNQTLKFEQITQPEEDVIIKEFSIKHPRSIYIDTEMGNFDGWIRKYRYKTQTMSRALLGELISVCKKHGLPLNIKDDRPPPKYPAPDPESIKDDILPGIVLDPHQLRAAKACCRAECGLVSVPTGGGKSEIIAVIAKMYNCPTVIIAEQIVVIEQIKKRLELRDVVEEVGLFCCGKRPNDQQVIVGSIQSIIIPSNPPKKLKKDTPESYEAKMKGYKTRRKNARTLREIIKKCDLLMVDECDKATTRNYRKLFRYWYKGRRRYGFSGTCEDPAKPVENLNMKENLGSIIARASRAELEAINRIIPVTYTAMAFGDPSQKHNKAAYDIAENDHIVENEKFHKLVSKLAIMKSNESDDHGVLILVEKINLGKALEELIPGSKFIYGKTSKTKRRKIIEGFENRDIKVLIGGKIVKRGLDLNGGCESLIIATGGRLWSDFDQKVGRAVRQNKRGFSEIYDFYFLCNYYLYEHSRGRLKAIVNMGYPAKVIFPHVVLEAKKFIKSRFRIPKKK